MISDSRVAFETILVTVADFHPHADRDFDSFVKHLDLRTVVRLAM